MSEEILPPTPPFECLNLGDPVDLATMLAQMKSSPRFARFIRAQLRKAFNGDEAAQNCLASYCALGGDDLETLGLPAGPLRCTEHGRLLSIVADGFI